jgi:outer membrane immunogenic protein
MKKLAFASLGVAALVATPAMAADMARPVYKAPPPAPVYVFSWTGCYFGGNVGGAWVDKDFALNSVSTPFGVITPAFGPVDLGGHTASSFIGGLQVGCNYQVPGSGFVFGIQGDYDWLKADGSHVDPIIALTTLQSNAKSLASVTGRVGYAWDRFLGYVKGGGAWERDEYTWFVTAAPSIALSASETRSGWTVGVGGEYAFTNWITGFIEYDYYDFGTRTVDFPVFAAPVSVNLDIKERKSVVKVGLNFLFGPGSAPVAAKY